VAKINLIMKAQALRGWTNEGRNPIKKISQLRPVLTPLIRYLIQSVDIISLGARTAPLALARSHAGGLLDSASATRLYASSL